MGRAADADVLLATTVAEVVARQVTEPELSCLPAVVSDEARELPLQFDVPEFEASPDRPQYSAPVCASSRNRRTCHGSSRRNGHALAVERDGRAAMEAEPESKGLADPVVERVVVGSGQNTVVR
jgi:hypothetical protein